MFLALVTTCRTGKGECMILKTLFIVILIGSISAVHLLYTGSSIGFHVLHQQLFYIPLVLASFWFGIRAGLVTAVAVSFLYGPAMILRHPGQGCTSQW